MTRLTVEPVTPARWPDVVRLFERHGNPGYCWCMRWRAPSADFQQLRREVRRQSLHELVGNGIPIGLLAYLDGDPIGWCSIAPRETYRALERSRTLPRLDDLPTWSVVCFFVSRSARSRGLSPALLRAAVHDAGEHGARAVEGYPVDPGATSYGFMGLTSTFEQAGFRDVTPRGRSDA